ncbi:XkdX family protein [Listeria booriae]|uniref:XkdX family protein n=1 Tax=Listeria booriae TaxID=1552123 RepID=UPI00164DD897|nr:XkdX family protein [Listeria booriae]MBC6128065.1 XkdX family protein [Listeria booriae]
MDWFEKVQRSFLAGYYTEENVQKFVLAKKITQEEADRIIAEKYDGLNDAE